MSSGFHNLFPSMYIVVLCPNSPWFGQRVSRHKTMLGRSGWVSWPARSGPATRTSLYGNRNNAWPSSEEPDSHFALVGNRNMQASSDLKMQNLRTWCIGWNKVFKAYTDTLQAVPVGFVPSLFSEVTLDFSLSKPATEPQSRQCCQFTMSP